jgi:archaellum component FlaC
MENQVIEQIKELFQNFIAPQLEGIKGDIRALDAKFEAKFGTVDAKLGTFEAKLQTVEAKIDGLDSKVESYRRELLAEVRRVEEVLSTDFVRLEDKVDLRLGSMNEKLELHRRELLAEIKAALK